MKKGMFKGLVLIAIASYLLSGCRKSNHSVDCPPDSQEYYTVSSEEKAFIPYKGTDTLKFKVSGSSSFSLAFYGKGRDSAYNLLAYSTSPDCPEHIYQRREHNTTKYISPDYTTSLSYTHYIPEYLRSSSNVKINFKLVTFETTADFYNCPSDNKSIFDSMEINGRVYYKVIKLHHNQGFSTEDTNYKAYYNASHGILKMIFANGEIWEKVP